MPGLPKNTIILGIKFTCNMQQDYEVRLANGVKSSPKAFWYYVNSKLKTRPSVESLKLADGGEAATDQEKANTLNSYFSSVFTNELRYLQHTTNW